MSVTPEEKALSLIIHNPKANDALKKYIQQQIEMHWKQFETDTDIERVRQRQGAIRELRRLNSLLMTKDFDNGD